MSLNNPAILHSMKHSSQSTLGDCIQQAEDGPERKYSPKLYKLTPLCQKFSAPDRNTAAKSLCLCIFRNWDGTGRPKIVAWSLLGFQGLPVVETQGTFRSGGHWRRSFENKFPLLRQAYKPTG